MKGLFKTGEKIKSEKARIALRYVALVIIAVSCLSLLSPLLGRMDLVFGQKEVRALNQNQPPKIIDLAKKIIMKNWRLNNYAQTASLAYKKTINAAILAETENNSNGQQEEIAALNQENYTQKNTVAQTAAAKNMLYIPKINVEMEIVEGKTEKALYQGAWRLPGTSMPDLGGNTVLGGHRWLYKPPSKKTFYNLDKLEIGDSIKVNWKNIEYNYQIKEIKIVEPKDISILYNTNDSRLTLFTCTPIYSSKQRLVVIAEKI